MKIQQPPKCKTKYTKMIKQLLTIFLFVFLTSIISSCYSNSNYSLEGEVLMNESELDQLTIKEKHFQDSLKSNGINVRIERTIIGRAGKEYARCRMIIDSSSIVVTPESIESIEEFRADLVTKLYKHVLSDSVIFCIDRISTEINGLEYKGVKHKDFFYLKDYMKTTLEEKTSIIIEKDNVGKLKRIFTTKI